MTTIPLRKEAMIIDNLGSPLTGSSDGADT